MKSEKEVHTIRLSLPVIPRAVVTWSPDVIINYTGILSHNSVSTCKKIMENLRQNVFSLLSYFMTFSFI